MERAGRIVLNTALMTVIVLCYDPSYAKNIMANSCSYSDVQSAVNSSSSGDSIIVPSGTCTWQSSLQIPSQKKILLQGGGIGVTEIVKSGTVIDLSNSGSRVSGFTFTDGTIYVDGQDWRIDNCRFHSNNNIFREGVTARGITRGIHPSGVIDHCEFFNTRVLVYGCGRMLAEGDDQHVLWSQPLSLGSGNNVVYVEDSTFTATVHSNAIDANYGGRYVFRYNTVNDTYIEAHSVQGDNRAAMRWEIYNNTFNQNNRSMWVPMFLRGGTGVVFNNTVTGTWGTGAIALDNVRSCRNVGVPAMCDGTSPWDSNQSGQAGYRCRDQIGSSTDQWTWSSSNPYPPQSFEPAYEWNNSYGSNAVSFYQHGCAESKAHIQPNRDYYINTPRPNYTPYTYPHPLVASWSSTSSMKNLRVLP